MIVEPPSGLLSPTSKIRYISEQCGKSTSSSILGKKNEFPTFLWTFTLVYVHSWVGKLRYPVLNRERLKRPRAGRSDRDLENDRLAHDPLKPILVVVLSLGQLVEAGANVNHQALNKWTPLHCASAAGDAHGCAILVEGGADINLEVGTPPRTGSLLKLGLLLFLRSLRTVCVVTFCKLAQTLFFKPHDVCFFSRAAAPPFSLVSR